MRTNPDAVLMFAAGFGTRMKPLTETRPKPLIEVGGRALIDHAMHLVDQHGVSRVVVNLHYKPEMIRSHFQNSKVILSEETPDILDTGGGLKAAIPLLGAGPVFTMNTDAVWSGPNPFTMLKDAWQPDLMDALLLCIPKEQAMGHAGQGDFLIEPDGHARRGAGLIYSGVQIIQTAVARDVEESAFSLNVIWDRLIAADRLFGLAYTGRWCDVGQPASISVAERMLAGGDV
ncbi:MAG: nucleotidyltransferase family protein [Pseudomonadota bacterium]